MRRTNTLLVSDGVWWGFDPVVVTEHNFLLLTVKILYKCWFPQFVVWFTDSLQSSECSWDANASFAKAT